MIAKKTVGAAVGFITKPAEVQPYKCKICGKWTKYASKGKGICKKCYDKMDEEEP